MGRDDASTSCVWWCSVSEDSDSEKSHEPSEKRLLDARKKGQVARSAEVTTAVAYGGYVLGFTLFGAAMLQQLGSLFLVAGAHQATDIRASLRSFLGHSALAILPILLLPALATLLSAIAQRNLLFTAENLRPKLERISLLKNVKKKFGHRCDGGFPEEFRQDDGLERRSGCGPLAPDGRYSDLDRRGCWHGERLWAHRGEQPLLRYFPRFPLLWCG
ncbi:MAG: hypothetical protein EBS68_15225 [Rhodobacteraceae bacterium]|nr:hypothetical protein [Paracoccaceae bacterium]